MPAPVLPSEPTRLCALADYALLDTPPEPEFDRLTALAAHLFQVPVALVTLVDAERQWFKSRCGVEISETPREQAFCAHTILENRPLIVPDAALDARFARNPLVVGPPHIRFYAGAQLTTREGANLGALCLIDTVPREFSDAEASTLKHLAAVVMAAVEARQTERLWRQESAVREQTAEALRLLEAKYQGIVEDTPGVVHQFVRHVDGSAEFLFVSDACRDILELEPAVLRQHAGEYFKLVHPEDRATYEQAAAESIVGMKLLQWEGRYVAPSGKVKRVQISSRPERLSNGDMVWHGVLLDVTERKRAEERLRMLESSLEHANDAIVITEAEPFDEPGPRIIYVNRAFTRTTGYLPEEVLGKNPRMFQGPKTDPESRAKIRKALKRWKAVRVEVLNYRKDGSEFWVELNIVPVANEKGWFTHWVSVQRETTEGKQAQMALEEARDEAQRANLAKSEFLSRMSHELRTPLNAILGFGQLLEMGIENERQREKLSHILKGGKHLLGLINEVLDIARIESGKLELTLEAVNVAEVYHEAAALIQPLAAQRGIRIGRCGGAAGEGALRADRQRLSQVVLNLLSNAVKYNRPGGTVSFACDPAQEPGRLRLAVSDTGPGIAPENLGKLFTPFERLGAERSGIEGTGIGLALCKRLVEAMGGTVGVESTPGRGSLFYLELPTASPAAPAIEAAPPVIAPKAFASEGPTLLCIEDNLSNYALVEQALETIRPNTRLLGAMQGRLGLDMAREHRPDLILLDLQLPDVNGDELLQRLQADESTRSIPVIMVSADATKGQSRRLLDLGARAYLTKPLDIPAFIQAVDEALAV